MTTNAKIIEIAKLMHKHDECADEGAGETGQVQDKLAEEMSQLNDPVDNEMVQLAYKILSGEPDSISTGSLELIDRYRSLANDLGATIEDGATGSGHAVDLGGRTAAARMSITIVPPTSED